MKLIRCILSCGSAVVLLTGLTGCQNPDGTQNNTASGALIGGAVGALTGAAIGGHHHAGEDALFGAAAGVVAGGLIGYSIDQQQAARLKAQAPQTYVRVDQGQSLSTADIKALAAAGVNDDTIISQINSSHSVYHLSSSDIVDLHNSGVSEKVVNYMINTASMASAAPAPVVPAPAAPPTVVVAPDQAYVAPPAPVEPVVVAPGPGYVWVSGQWAWQGKWVWVRGHWAYPPRPYAVWVTSRSWHDHYGWHYAPGYWR
jgi:outer membrane lipoprotein SlyB